MYLYSKSIGDDSLSIPCSKSKQFIFTQWKIPKSCLNLKIVIVCYLLQLCCRVDTTFSNCCSFGAKFRSLTSGIIYNNELADFFRATNGSAYPWPRANAPGPGKRPLSSTCPSIIVDENGDVKMVVGASGGLRITLSVAWVC